MCVVCPVALPSPAPVPVLTPENFRVSFPVLVSVPGPILLLSLLLSLTQYLSLALPLPLLLLVPMLLPLALFPYLFPCHFIYGIASKLIVSILLY